MKKTLITGIGGFTGIHLSRHLRDRGLAVYGIDCRPLDKTSAVTAAGGLHLYTVDIRIRSRTAAIIRELKPDFIFHLAGLISTGDTKILRAANITGTENVLAATGSSRTRILVPGSAAEYGMVEKNMLPVNEKTPLCPMNPYGKSKAAQTALSLRYFAEHGCAVYIARPFNIIGPGQPQSLLCSAVARQIVRIEQGKQKPVIEVGNLDTVRDFIDVRDVVRAYWDIVSKGMPGETYNICSGSPYSVRDIVEMLGSIAGLKFDIKQLPELKRESDVPVMVGDNTKLKNATGWQPAISIEQTLRDILQELRSNN